MAKVLQHRRGTRAEHATFDGAPGEITVVTDGGSETAVVHTVGGAGTGVELARKDSVDAVKTKTDKMNVSAITSMVVNADGTITITV
jgi:hypothetical protein